MNGARYYALVAQQALAAGRPLSPALEDAARMAPPAPAPVRAAIGRLQGGDLAAGLTDLVRLGLDPLVAEAAQLEPRSAVEVQRRLDALPERFLLSLPVRGMLVYLGAVFLLQGLVLAVVDLKVVPSLLHWSLSGRPLAHLSWVGWAELLALGLTFASGALMTGPGCRLVLRSSLRALQAARVFSAAAGVASVGSPQVVVQFLAAHPEAGAPSSASRLTLDEAAQLSARQALQRASRAVEALKVGGTAVALAVAVGALVAIYSWLPALGRLP